MPNNNFDNLAQKLQNRIQEVMRDIPRIVGNEAVNTFLDNFEQQGFQGDTGLQRWQTRKKIDKKNPSRLILIKTGALRRSIRITSISTGSVHIGTNLPYARVHNEGLTIVQPPRSETFKRNRFVRGDKKGKFKKGIMKQQHGFSFKERTINMPKRQFIGNSKVLNARLRAAAIATFKQRLTGS